MGYYSGNTFNYKKLGGVWMHKDCQSKPGAKVKEFLQYGSTYLQCQGEKCQSSAEQVIKGETKRSTLSEE